MFLKYFAKVVPDGPLIVVLFVLLVFYEGLGKFVVFRTFSSCFTRFLITCLIEVGFGDLVEFM